eukprot:jgi/Chlat1/5302/Chrsp35S05194
MVEKGSTRKGDQHTHLEAWTWVLSLAPLVAIGGVCFAGGLIGGLRQGLAKHAAQGRLLYETPDGPAGVQGQAATFTGIDDDMVQLVQSMTLAQKIGQMVMVDASVVSAADASVLNGFDITSNANSVLGDPYYVGSVVDGPASEDTLSAFQWRALVSAAQQLPANNGLNVPIAWALTNVHGANHIRGATVFPQQMTLAATFNKALAYSQVEPALTQLWSRFYEHSGEDPHLASQMASNLIAGMKGSSLATNTSVGATACGFIGSTAPMAGRDSWPSTSPDQYVMQYASRQFRDAIAAGAAAVQAGFHELNGLPVTINSNYTQGLLRTSLGFQGVLVSARGEISNLYATHQSAANFSDAVRMAMQDSSIDIASVGTDLSFLDVLRGLVEDGTVPEDRVTESAARVLQMKKNLDLFNNPVPVTTTAEISSVGGADDQDLSLNIAREAITLLRNENGTLPLSANISSLLVVGPAADSTLLLAGGYTVNDQGAPSDADVPGVNILQGIQALFPSATYQKGCELNGSIASSDLSRAVTAAQAAAGVIVCIGEATYAAKGGDVPTMELSEGQRTLTASLIATGTPVIVVYVGGRPLLMSGATNGAAGFVYAGLPGPQGGQAVAEVVFGVTNPSGRLPFTWPLNPLEVPMLYFRKFDQTCVATGKKLFQDLCACSPSGDCLTEFEFGNGLTYSSFAYSALSVSPQSISVGDSVTVSLTVTNSGGPAGKHAVLVFLTQAVRTVPPERALLKGFTKVDLEQGASTQVDFTLTPDDMQYWEPNQQVWVVDQGEFTVNVGDVAAQFAVV